MKKQPISEEAEDGTFISLYFGKRHKRTLDEFDSVCREIRASRTNTLNYLLRLHKAVQKKESVDLFVTKQLCDDEQTWREGL